MNITKTTNICNDKMLLSVVVNVMLQYNDIQ